MQDTCIKVRINKVNNIELKATRLGLCLTSEETAKLFDVKARSVNYWEIKRYSIPDEVDLSFFIMSSHYTLLLKQLKNDIDTFNKKNPLPITDDAEEYSGKMKHIKKLSLPFFISFKDYKKKTGNQSESYWRIWQSVISHLFIVGELRSLDDNAEIPDYFSCLSWLRGDYDPS